MNPGSSEKAIVQKLSIPYYKQATDCEVLVAVFGRLLVNALTLKMSKILSKFNMKL